MMLRLACLILLLAGALAPASAEARRFAYTLSQAGEPVGYLKAEETGDTARIDYHVDSNGRGPKHREEIRIDAAGLPVSWQIEGTSLMGAPVSERFFITDGTARWQSQADAGEVTLSGPALYAVNDASPWADYVYARALLNQPGRRLPVLPAGEISLEEVTEVAVAGAGQSVRVTVYRLAGIDLSASLIALDGEGHFFARFSTSSAIIREGFETGVPQLLQLAEGLSAEQTRALAHRLTHRYGAFSIANVRLLDARTAGLSPPVTVTVEANRIAGIELYEEGTLAPGPGPAFDGAGGVIMPGLVDMHAHTSATNGLYYLAAGVTSTRDMGNDNAALEGLLERMAAGELAGPRITRAGFVEGRSPFSARTGIIAASEQEALDAVDWYGARGYGYIKSYNSMNPDWIPAVAARAREHGMRLIGHIPAFTNADAMIEAGFTEVTHINQLMLGWLLDPSEDTRTPLRLTGMARGASLDLNSEKVRASVARMQANKVAIDPTAVILERLMLSRAGQVADGDAAYLDHMPIGYQRYRRRSFVTLAGEAEDEAYREGFRRVLETLKMLHEAGIVILPGTDDATGFTVHREIELYTLAGIPVADALRIAAWAPIAHMGYGEILGALEPGRLADFILLSSNPLEDINAIRTPRMVVRGGEVFYPSEIYEALSIRPFAAPPADLRAAGVDAAPVPGPDLAARAEARAHAAAAPAGNICRLCGPIVQETVPEIFPETVQETAGGAGMDAISECTVLTGNKPDWPALGELCRTCFTPGAFGADGLTFSPAQASNAACIWPACQRLAPENSLPDIAGDPAHTIGDTWN